MGDRGVEYTAILMMFTGLSFVSVCFRCFVRWKWTGLGWDDFLAVLALVSPAFSSLLGCYADRHAVVDFYGHVYY